MSRIILDSENNNNSIENVDTKNNENTDERNLNLTGSFNEKSLITDSFATAFPEWNLTPPMQIIKRVRRGL